MNKRPPWNRNAAHHRLAIQEASRSALLAAGFPAAVLFIAGLISRLPMAGNVTMFVVFYVALYFAMYSMKYSHYRQLCAADYQNQVEAAPPTAKHPPIPVNSAKKTKVLEY